MKERPAKGRGAPTPVTYIFPSLHGLSSLRLGSCPLPSFPTHSRSRLLLPHPCLPSCSHRPERASGPADFQAPQGPPLRGRRRDCSASHPGPSLATVLGRLPVNHCAQRWLACLPAHPVCLSNGAKSRWPCPRAPVRRGPGPAQPLSTPPGRLPPRLRGSFQAPSCCWVRPHATLISMRGQPCKGTPRPRMDPTCRALSHSRKGSEDNALSGAHSPGQTACGCQGASRTWEEARELVSSPRPFLICDISESVRIQPLEGSQEVPNSQLTPALTPRLSGSSLGLTYFCTCTASCLITSPAHVYMCVLTRPHTSWQPMHTCTHT